MSKIEYIFEDLYPNIIEELYLIASHDPLIFEILCRLSGINKSRLANIRTLNGELMLSYYKNNEEIMENLAEFLDRKQLFEKNRNGNFLIQTLLNQSNMRFFEDIDVDQLIFNIYDNDADADNLILPLGIPGNKFMYYCQNLDTDKLLEILEKFDNNIINKLFASVNEKSISGLSFIVRYHPNILEKYIDIIDDNIFLINNIFGETLGMYAIRYNVESYNILVKYNKITIEQNYTDINSGSLLTYSLKYNDSLFENIIHSIYIKDNIDLIDFTDTDLKKIKINVNLTNIIIGVGNILAFHVFRKMFPSVLEKHINEMFNICYDDFYSLKYALLSEPDIAEIIIGSTFCTPEYIKKICETFPDNDIRCIAIIQPASWLLIKGSAKFSNYYLPHQDMYHYSKKTNIGYIIENNSDVLNIATKKQIYNYNNAKSACNICGLAKASILYSTCLHKYCVCCSLIELDCPVCKIKTPSSLKFYIE